MRKWNPIAVLFFLPALLLMAGAVVPAAGCGGNGADSDSAADADDDDGNGDDAVDGDDADGSDADASPSPPGDDGSVPPPDGAAPPPADGAADPPQDPPGAAREATVDELVAQLDDPDQEKVLAAIRELNLRGEEAAPAAPRLAALLGSDDAQVAGAAALALSSIGPAAGEQAPQAVAALKHNSPVVRAYAAYAIGELGDKSEPTVRALAAATVDEDPRVRRQVFQALQKLRPPRELTIPLFVQTLKNAQDSDPAVLQMVLMSLAEQGEAVVPVLRDALSDPEAAHWATVVLGEIGPPAAEAVPDLVKLLDRDEPETRMDALQALGKIGEAAAPAIPKIVELMENDPQQGVRYNAVFALIGIGQAEGAVEPLKRTLENGDEATQVLSALALARLQPEDAAVQKSSIEVIAAGLQSEREEVRMMAAEALALHPGSSELVAPVIEREIATANEQTINRAKDALVRLGPAAVPRLLNGLKSPRLRVLALEVLAAIGPDAKEALPAVSAAYKSDDGSDAEYTTMLQFALGSLGGTEPDLLPKLAAATRSSDDRIRMSALHAIKGYGPAGGEAAAEISPLLEDENETARFLAAVTLAHIKPADQATADRVLPILRAGLLDESVRPGHRVAAAEALGALGPLAKPAVAELKQMADLPEPYYQDAAEQALAKIEGA